MKYRMEDDTLIINEGVTEINKKDIDETYASVVILPSTLEKIGPYTFMEMGIEEIKFNKNLKSIGDYAFSENELYKIKLPVGIEIIGEGAFSNNGIESVNLPESIKMMSRKAFENNEIRNIVLPSNLTVLEESVFMHNRIKEIKFNEKIRNIEQYALAYNKILNIELPNTITNIGPYAFKSNAIEKLKIPDKVNYIEEGSFQENLLKEVTLGKNNFMIDEEALSYNKIEKINFNSSLEFISTGALRNNNIKNIDLPNSLKVIGQSAFENNKIENLIIPENVEMINHYAFKHNNINSLELNKNLDVIGTQAFSSNNLKEIDVHANSIGDYAFEQNNLEKVNINNKDIRIGVNAFDTDNLYYDGVSFTKEELSKFNSKNIEKIITFKKNIKDYNIMNVEKYELDLMPNDKNIFKQYKSNYKKYIILLNELNLEKDRIYFKLAFLLGLFKNPNSNVKEFILFINNFNYEELRNILSNYDIKDSSDKLTELSLQFVKEGKEVELFKKVLKENRLIFDRMTLYKKDQIAKLNTKRIKNEKENKDTTLIQNELIEKKKNLKKLNYDEIIEFYKSRCYNIKPENSKLSEIAITLSSYINDSEFDSIQKIYERYTKNDELYFKNYKGSSEHLSYQWLESSDPRNLILGYLLNCCAKLGGAGEDIMIQSVVNPKIKNLVITKNKKIIGKSTVYYNNDYLLCNNIEMKDGVTETQESFDLIVKALKEQAKHLNVNKVNIGLSCNDLINEIRESGYETICRGLLDNYDFDDYEGDANCEQVRILK